MIASLVVWPGVLAQDFTLGWHFTGEYRQANLTWNGGQGRLEWTPDPSSEDNKPEDPHTSRDYYVDEWGRDLGPAYAPLPKTSMTFRGAPLPQTLFLNGSRPVQFELFLKVPPPESGETLTGQRVPCGREDRWYIQPDVEVRLLWGDRVVAGFYKGGSVEAAVGRSFGDFDAPPNPSGYSACRFAMAPEVGILPAGTELRLEVTFLQQDYPYPIGFQEEHRSNIRFPVFDPEEAVFRFPEWFVDSAEEPVAGAGVAGLLLLAFPGVRRRAGLGATLLVLSVALGGCLAGGGQSTPDATGTTLPGDATSTQIRDFANLTRAGRGSILGVVFDESHIPVEGVRVGVIGAINSTKTDARGRFGFANLAPGPAVLRFDKAGFESFEATVQVKAGFIAKPTIKLQFSDPKLRNFRPHDHDYWPKGEGTVQLVTNHVACENSGCGSASFVVPSKADAFNTVLPGTSDVEVVLDWTPAEAGFERMGLAVRTNANDNDSLLVPRGPRAAFHLATTWEMTDVGHQKYSFWEFRPYIDDAQAPGLLEPKLDQGDGANFRVTAQVRITKGALPLERAHPDAWGDKDRLEVAKDFSASSSSYQQGSTRGWQNCPAPPAARPYYSSCTELSHSAEWSPKKFVPYGTQTLEVSVKFARSVPFTPQFLFKGADRPPRPSGAKDFQGFTTASAPTGSGDSFSWRVLVTGDQTDPPYAAKSSWTFAVRAPDADAGWSDYASNPNSSPTPSLTVYALKSASP